MKLLKNIFILLFASFFANSLFTQCRSAEKGCTTRTDEPLYSNTFHLSDVKLLDGPLKHATDLNTHVLLQYETDRLLAPFLKEAGLTPKGESFPNWVDLDGHVGGHYLSALAIHYAATGNKQCKQRMEYFISELKRCQQAHGNGYVGGVPHGEKIWTEIKNGHPQIVWNYWVPWYNLHKTYAGLRDAWAYGGSKEAKQMFLDLCDWGLTIIEPLDDNQMEAMLANEFGGMNEVYADAYQMTGHSKYLNAATRFSHKEIFDSMAARTDNLDNKHANTQVPKAVGYQRVAELSGDTAYITASEFFWETVANNRSLSFGGNSRREHFPTKADCHSYTEEKEGPETCNTHNLLKLTEGLFRMNPDAKYIDFYERAMFNHILSSQHPEHGGYVYFTSARPRHYRVYSAPNEAMWCCVGTGMENHGKYGELIYSHRGDSLFVNLFVASELTWRDKGVVLTQHTAFPDEEGSTLTINVDAPVKFKLLVRCPWWISADMQVVCNGENYAVGSSPSSYIEIERTWINGDVVTIKTPMKNTIEEMPNVPTYISVLRGPILLAAKTGTEDLRGLVAGDDRWAHIASGKLLPITEAPFSIGHREEIQTKLDKMKPVEGKSLTFTIPGLFNQSAYNDLVFEPFFRVHDSRYLMYWMSMTEQEYKEYNKKMALIEQEKMILEERTVDMVTPGEQQPEVDHQMKSFNSNSGHAFEEGFRKAQGNDGYFSYNLLTKGRNDLSLMVRYWGNENGNRTFDILINDQLLVTENISRKWQKDDFVNVEYKIPSGLLKGKTSVTVTFKSKTDNVAGGVFKVRLVKTKP